MKNIIEVSDISRHYNVGKQIVKALDSISVNIKKMSMYLHGCIRFRKINSKNIIGCLDSPTGGKYKLNNKDVSNMSEDELADIRNKRDWFCFSNF